MWSNSSRCEGPVSGSVSVSHSQFLNDAVSALQKNYQKMWRHSPSGGKPQNGVFQEFYTWTQSLYVFVMWLNRERKGQSVKIMLAFIWNVLNWINAFSQSERLPPSGRADGDEWALRQLFPEVCQIPVDNSRCWCHKGPDWDSHFQGFPTLSLHVTCVCLVQTPPPLGHVIIYSNKYSKHSKYFLLLL